LSTVKESPWAVVKHAKIGTLNAAGNGDPHRHRFKDSSRNADVSGRIRTCGRNKLHAHLFGEDRVDVGFEDQWMDNFSMADRDPTFTVDKNGQRHFSQMAWINKRPMTSITAQVTP
jgi:hypothetical protein